MTDPDGLTQVPGFTAGRKPLEAMVVAGMLSADDADAATLLVLLAAAPHIKAECLADLSDATAELAADNPQHAESIGQVARLLDELGAQIRKELNA